LNSQGKKKRQHGTEAVKSHIVAAKTVANIVKSSLVRTLPFNGMNGI
jgi:T-complex protein 1 subunit epsilon